MPEKITIDKSGANTAAIVSMQADSGLPIAMRQSKYLNNLIEQDHGTIKRITRPMLGFKSSRCARILICGIEPMHMIRKGQLGDIKDRWATLSTTKMSHICRPLSTPTSTCSGATHLPCLTLSLVVSFASYATRNSILKCSYCSVAPQNPKHEKTI